MPGISRSRAVLALVALAGPLHAQDNAAETAKVFGARQSVLDASISPDGNNIAIVSPGSGGEEVLYVANLQGDATPRPITRVSNVNEDLAGCSWATNVRLVCRIAMIANDGGMLLGFSRQFALDKDGSNVTMLSAAGSSRALGTAQNGGSIIALDVAGEENKILMTRQFVPEETVGTMLARTVEGLGVEEVDIRNGKRSTVENGRKTADWYLADESGTVRMMALQRDDGTGYDQTETGYMYREKGSREWKPFDRVKMDSQIVFGFNPVAIDSAQNVVYGFEQAGGHQALVSYSLDGARTRNIVLARPDADVDSLLRIGRDRRVVGASWATEKRAVAFFDPELKALASALGQALPGKPAIEFVDASSDESKLLMIASSDVDPGQLYLFDKTTKQLGQVLPLRADLSGRKMAEMKPVSFPAADGTSIPGYLTLPVGSAGKGLPAIVMPHGGPSSRDEWGFDWLVQYFAARGYAVLQPNYRGSSGYGTAWFKDNGFKSWKTAIGDVDDAGRWLVSQGIADPEKLAIVGWSYGGYAALQSQVLDPQLYKAVVAIAPVTDLERLREDHRRYSDYRLVSAFVGEGPHIEQGSPARSAGSFAAPVLLIHGDYDQNVSVVHSRMMADRLKSAGKDVRFIEYEKLDHYIDDSDQRASMLVEIDAFLNKKLGS